MSRKCLFCGSKDLSKEHIIPQWLLKELGIYDEKLYMSHGYMGINISERIFVYNKLVNTLVCTKCNNEWMSNLEDTLKRYLISLINMDVDVKEAIEHMKNNTFQFAKWFFKTSILLNYPTNYRELVPSNHFKELYDGNIPQGVYIDIGITDNDEKVNWRQSQDGLVLFDNKKYDVKNIININRRKYTITYQFKHLLFRVRYVPLPYENLINDSEGMIHLHPNFGVQKEFKIFKDIDDFDLTGVIHII